ncbi:MAG TPA: hypothetical protein VK250_00415 [Nitrososphaeraceae archaeon]|nr:hypothetical protein [Nitrososphaeraceae archaeon]
MENILFTLMVLLGISKLELLYPKHIMHSPLEDPDRRVSSISNRTDAFTITIHVLTTRTENVI